MSEIKEVKRGYVQKGQKYGDKLTLKESYSSFEFKDKLNSTEYMKIIKRFSELFMISVLDGDLIKLPNLLGTFLMMKRKMRNNDNRCNWNASINAGEIVPYVNIHSDEYIARLHWNKEHAHFQNQSLWKFDLTKDNKSRNEISIAKHIKKHGTNNFYELLTSTDKYKTNEI